MSGFGGYCPLPVRLGGSSTEGLTAAQHARVCSDLVAVSRTMPFAWVTFTASGDPIVPRVIAYNGMTGMGTQYRPLITTLSSSSFNVVWNATHNDAYAVPEPLAIRHAHASLQGSIEAYVSCFWQPGESDVGVFVFDGTGAGSFAATAVTLYVT